MLMWIEKIWYTRWWICWLLWPISLIYQGICNARRWYLQRFCQQPLDVPVIVVGNISVGGVGKTPLVIALAEQLCARGLRVGIVSRGYGAKIRQFPHEIKSDDVATNVGDEPLLLAKKTKCPVIIAPNRVKAVQYLLKHYQSQIIISDDGLQHYAMNRAIEIAVIDGVRGFGNGLCLPAGPLRESTKRLQQVDFVVVNGAPIVSLSQVVAIKSYSMNLIPGALTTLINGKTILPEQLNLPIAAVAGIGHPQRFFTTLQGLNISFRAYSFNDHYAFKPQDFCFTEKTIVMTEKDAVKCFSFATENMYFLPVKAVICDTFWSALWSHQQLQGYI